MKPRCPHLHAIRTERRKAVFRAIIEPLAILALLSLAALEIWFFLAATTPHH